MFARLFYGKLSKIISENWPLLLLTLHLKCSPFLYTRSPSCLPYSHLRHVSGRNRFTSGQQAKPLTCTEQAEFLVNSHKESFLLSLQRECRSTWNICIHHSWKNLRQRVCLLFGVPCWRWDLAAWESVPSETDTCLANVSALILMRLRNEYGSMGQKFLSEVRNNVKN